ncbi:MAG: hypothetical protein KDC90_13050, partial [Ignavibacteriae bacterium]|nr:hypothetical protein [Ignavibacteriota bacterium]
FYGEIFALDKNLIPNARRDYFVENKTLKSFERALTQELRDPLHKLYYYASNVRSASRRIEQLENFKKEYDKKANEIGFSTKEEKEKYEDKFDALKEKAKSAENDLVKLKAKIDDDSDPKGKIFDNIAVKNPKVDKVEIDTGSKQKKTKFATDDLSRLNSKERKLISKVFGVIDVVLTPDLAENLKQKIKTEFK